MLKATHVHTANLRPDRVWATSVVAPYNPRMGPVNIARKIVGKFAKVAGDRTLSGALGRGARIHSDMQPEEFAALAAKLASAMRQGLRPPRAVDQRLLAAARLIIQNKPFEIRSAGRAAVVAARGASSWPSLQIIDEGGYRY